MKRNLAIQGIALWFVLVASAGCSVSRAAEAEKMYILGSALTKLSASVEATVRYENPPVGIGDAELLALATKHDPGLMAPFADNKVQVLRESEHAILLVCDKEGRVGLLEDAGCSAPMDNHLWNGDPPKPCKFTIDIKVVCPEPAPQ
jgi:hypothetical protein